MTGAAVVQVMRRWCSPERCSLRECCFLGRQVLLLIMFATISLTFFIAPAKHETSIIFIDHRMCRQ